MDKLDTKNALFVYPDPVTTPGMLTGSAFLYFDKPLIVTLPPQVITPGSFEMLKLVNERAPAWSSTIYGLLGTWRQQQDGFRDCIDMLSPLKGKKLKVVWTTYNANKAALEQSQQLVEAAGRTLEEAAEFVDPLNAAGEIVRHIFLEAYLESGEDVNGLFAYCDSLFQTESVSSLLTKGYFLRAPFLSAMAQGDVSLLLTNQRLLPLFDALPIEPENRDKDWRDFQDVVSWELFRRIISPSVDPLTPEKVELISKMLDKRHGAIEAMKGKCYTLAYDVEAHVKESDLERVLEKIVRSASSEISDLLAIDKKATQDFVTELLADEKAWLSFAAAITGLVAGGVSLTAGAAIASFANIGAKAFKAASNRHQRLRSSEFALMYFLHNQ
jgi:hypothetical protein